MEYVAPYVGHSCPNPPLGILTLASTIAADCDLEIRDENVRPVEFETDAEIVAISGTFLDEFHVSRVVAIASYFRKLGKIVCIGGPVANLTPDDMKAHCDVLFRGEGELTWPQFIKDFKQGAYKDNYVQEEKFDMSQAPVPRIDLISAKDYGAGIVQTTRGCPFSCEFCDIIVVFGRKVRAKPIATVIAELTLWANAGQHMIFFCDDNFVGNRVYVKALLRELIKFNAKRKHPLCFFTQASIDTAKDIELMELMRDANFAGIFVGIESPRKSSLAETLKFQNVCTKDLVEAVHKIQSYGLWVSGGMIVGFDHDDNDIFEEQYNFLQEAGVVRAQLSLLHAVPMTPLYDRIKLDGRLIENQEKLATNIKPLLMTYEEMVKGYIELHKRTYSYDAYLERYLNSLANMKEHTFSGDKPAPTLKNMLALLNVVKFYCLTTDGERRQFFLKMIFGTLKINPHAWKWAIRYATSYIHFQKFIELDILSTEIRLPREMPPQSMPLEELKAS